jgi:hypothetical protein
MLTGFTEIKIIVNYEKIVLFTIIIETQSNLIPTGVVTIKINNNEEQIYLLLVGKINFPTNLLINGNNKIKVKYSGDRFFLSSELEKIITLKYNTITTIISNNNYFIFGDNVMLNIFVTNLNNIISEGNIIIYDNGNKINSTYLNIDGTLDFTINTLDIGDHTIMIQYEGNNILFPSSAEIKITIIRQNINMKDIFSNIYEKNNDIYKNNDDDKYNSFLQEYIINNNIKNIVDLGCGYFENKFNMYDNIEIKYIGYDIYDKLININKEKYLNEKYNFMFLDIYNNMENIICGDLCILKEVLQHWPLNEINIFLDYLVKSNKFKYILISNNCAQRRNNTHDIKTGGFRSLSCKYLPLKKYNTKEVFKYSNKEISEIKF